MATPVDKRQSEYPIRAPDILDRFLLAENPDPAGDSSFLPRVTAQANLRAIASMIRKAVVSSGTAQAVSGEVIPVDLGSASITVTAPASPSPGDWFAVKIFNQVNPNVLTVSDASFNLENPANGWDFAGSQVITAPGAIVGWTLFEVAASDLRWIVSGSHKP